MAGLIGLGIFYQLFRWCVYKVHMVKEDKKRVKEMLAQDLPGKPRYPLFSAAAGLFFSLDIEELEQDESVTIGDSAGVTVAPVAAVASSSHLKRSQGAYMDGPEPFVDLEANLQSSSSGNSKTEGNKKKRKNNRKKRKEDGRKAAGVTSDQRVPLATTELTQDVPIALPKEEVSDSSEASSVREETDDHSNHQTNPSDDLLRKESGACYSFEHSEHSEGTYLPNVSRESGDKEPSDDADVIYSLSSIDGSRSHSGEGTEDSGTEGTAEEDPQNNSAICSDDNRHRPIYCESDGEDNHNID